MPDRAEKDPASLALKLPSVSLTTLPLDTNTRAEPNPTTLSSVPVQGLGHSFPPDLCSSGCSRHWPPPHDTPSSSSCPLIPQAPAPRPFPALIPIPCSWAPLTLSLHPSSSQGPVFALLQLCPFPRAWSILRTAQSSSSSCSPSIPCPAASPQHGFARCRLSVAVSTAEWRLRCRN